MGLFGGNPDKGLYTGDAPVSIPGTGGQPPQLYVGPQYVAHDDHSVRPSQRDIDPDILPRDAAPGTLPAATKKRGIGAAVVALLIVGLVAGGAAWFSSAEDSTTTVSTGGDLAGGSVSGFVSEPDQVPRYGMQEAGVVAMYGARYAITPKAAFAEPGRGFAYATPDDEPQLLISTGVERLDDGSDPAGPSWFNWEFDTPDGTTIDAELAPTYHPYLGAVSIVGGESDSGYLVFRTDATEGVLRFTTNFDERTLAAWTITADSMKTVVGTFGDPIWADISIPRFTVAVDEPRQVTVGDPSVRFTPQSGQYLTFDVDIVPNQGSSGYLGLIDTRSFGFVPAGSATDDNPFAGALDSVYGAVDGALSVESLSAGSEIHATLAFDTAATDGRLYFFNGGDWALIDWAVGSG